MSSGRGTGEAAWPPEPWGLRGTLWASLWAIPIGLVPEDRLGPGLVPAEVRGHVAVATAFARYDPGGDLAYDELLVAVRAASRDGGCTHVPRIWVDSPASKAGARAMWRVPKELGRFEMEQADGALTARAADLDGAPLAALSFRSTIPLPGRWPLATRVGQGPLAPGDADLTLTPVSSRFGVTLGRAAWTFAPGGPLGFMAGRRPVASFSLRGATLTFGG